MGTIIWCVKAIIKLTIALIVFCAILTFWLLSSGRM